MPTARSSLRFPRPPVRTAQVPSSSATSTEMANWTSWPSKAGPFACSGATGTGRSRTPDSVSVFGQPVSVAVGDFNDDGLLDLGVTSVTVSQTPYDTIVDGYATVLLGNGAGGVVSGSAIHLGSGYPGSAAVGDFNSDHRLDFVCVQSPAYSGDFNQVTVLFGDGNGHIGAGASYYFPYENSVTDVVTGDVDGDGDTDLALGRSQPGRRCIAERRGCIRARAIRRDGQDSVVHSCRRLQP